MKKIFTLLAVAFATCSFSNAQCPFKFTDAEGNEIKDGTTLNMSTLETNDWGDSQYSLTDLYVQNTSEDEEAVYMTATIDAISDGSFTCCFGTQCRNTSAANAVLNINNVTVKASSINAISNTEWTPGTSTDGHCTVTLQLGTEEEINGPKVTVRFGAVPTAIQSIAAGQNKVVNYDLSGRQTNDKKGVKIIRTTDNKTKKVITK